MCEVLCKPCHKDESLRSGVFHRGAKLGPDDVAYIREQAGVARAADLALELGVNERTVRDVIAHRTWRTIPELDLADAS